MFKHIKSEIFFIIIAGLLSQVAFAESGLVKETIPDQLAYLYSQPSTDATNKNTLNQLYARERRWENGRVLRVCLYSGNPSVSKLIRDVASEWNTYSGVKLDFGPAGSWYNCLSPQVGFPEIRIGFSDRGYWSYVGKDSERYAGERVPSMNLEGFNRIYNESQFNTLSVVEKANAYHKAAIRHEFGHALGLLHEHQNPTLNCRDEIRWTGPGNIYDYFGGAPNFWAQEQVDRNLGFIGQSDPDYVAGEPDSKSVMMYSLDSKIFKNGSSKCAVPENYLLSIKDKAIISKIYPAILFPSNKDIDIKLAQVSFSPSVSRSLTSEDYFKRLMIDIESNDATVRRNARARLTLFIASSNDKNKLSKLITDIPMSSYRYGLGVAVALENLDQFIFVDKKASSTLTKLKNNTQDDTFRKSIEKATLKVKTE